MAAGLLGCKNYLHLELLANFVKVIHGRCIVFNLCNSFQSTTVSSYCCKRFTVAFATAIFGDSECHLLLVPKLQPCTVSSTGLVELCQNCKT